MKPRVIAALGPWLLAACSESPDGSRCAGITALVSADAADAPASYCGACAEAVVCGDPAKGAINEVSGIVASALHPGAYYVHNDSGDGARFFAIGSSGGDLGTFQVSGASNLDWEDIARGPCPSGACLYLADTGDSRGDSPERPTYAIYRVPEPASLGGDQTVPAEVLPFRYPDGSHDAEALLVHPTTGVVTIVTKVNDGASSVYELPMPLTPNDTVTAALRGKLVPPAGSPKITGGDVHPEGRGVLLRTGSAVFFFEMDATQSVASALAGDPCAVPSTPEKQGEAVAWLLSGAGFVTIGEGGEAALSWTDCRKTR
jgi:hypothetical protein